MNENYNTHYKKKLCIFDDPNQVNEFNDFVYIFQTHFDAYFEGSNKYWSIMSSSEHYEFMSNIKFYPKTVEEKLQKFINNKSDMMTPENKQMYLQIIIFYHSKLAELETDIPLITHGHLLYERSRYNPYDRPNPPSRSKTPSHSKTSVSRNITRKSRSKSI